MPALRLGFLSVFLVFLMINSLLGQSEVKVSFKAEPIVMDTLRMGIAPVYRYVSDTVNYRGYEGVIRIPDNFEAQDTGYFYSFFTGRENPYFDRNIMVLVANYKSDKPSFWVDQNGNLDFSDDGEPIIAAPDASVVVPFQNAVNAAASFSVKFFQKERDSSEIQMLEKFFGKEGLNQGQYLEKVEYWFSEQRMNTKEFIGEIDGTRVKLGLHDYDCDGLYTRNGKDRVLINEDPNGKLSTRVIDGASILGDTSILVIGSDAYEILEVEASGKSLVLRKTTLPQALPLKIGSILPNYQVQLNGKAVSLDELLEEKAYLFIDIWGSWCKGCISQVASVKAFSEEHAALINIVGLNHGDTPASKAAFIEKYALNWPNSELTEEISAGLSIEGYPTYLLIDSDRRLLMYESSVYRIGEYLREVN